MAANGKESIDFDRENEMIRAGLNVIDEYESLGVMFPSKRPRANGIVECFAAGRDESRPSAGVNAKTGRYFVMGGSGESHSLWDFAAACSISAGMDSYLWPAWPRSISVILLQDCPSQSTCWWP